MKNKRLNRVPSISTRGINWVWLGLAIALAPLSAAAAVDMFINFGTNIKGESQDKVQGPKGDCDVLAWSWGASMSSVSHTSVGAGTGKAIFQDISFAKYIDTATTPLLTALAKGSHLPTVVLLVRKAGTTPVRYIQMTFSDVLVASYSVGGSGGQDRVTENITLNFGAVKYEYFTQDTKGVEKPGGVFSWNVVNNSGNSIGGEPTSTPVPALLPADGSISAPAVQSLKTLVHANAADQIKAHEEVRQGVHYLAVEVVRARDQQSAKLLAQTSTDLKNWSQGSVIEEEVSQSENQQASRYLIPMEKAQQFLRVSAE